MADSLMQAFSVLQEGVKQYQLSSSINGANQTVQQIKASSLDEAQKMEQIRNVANDLTLHLASSGTPATTIEQVKGAFAPPQPSEFQKNVYMDQLKNQDVLGQLKAKQDFDAAEKAKDRASHEKIAGMKSDEKDHKPLDPASIKSFNELDKSFIQAEGLLQKVTSDPALAGLKNVGVLGRPRKIFDKEYAQFAADQERWFQAFKHSMTGAQASEKEMDQLRAALPVVDDPPAVYKQKMIGVLAEGEKIRDKYIDNLEKGGHKIASNFRQPFKYANITIAAPGGAGGSQPAVPGQTPGASVTPNKYMIQD